MKLFLNCNSLKNYSLIGDSKRYKIKKNDWTLILKKTKQGKNTIIVHASIVLEKKNVYETQHFNMFT